MNSAVKKVILLFLLWIVALYICLPRNVLSKLHLPSSDINLSIGTLTMAKKFDLVLGLDIAGGSHIVFDADTSKVVTSEKQNALEGLKNIIERRVNLFGVSEPNVQVSSFEGKDRIVVELPGVKDTDEAIKLIGKTAQLVFASVEDADQTKDASGSAVLVPTDLGGADLESAQPVFDKNTGKPAVSIEFNETGAKKFERLTGENIGKPLAILLDNEIVSTPIVQEKITGGIAQISGIFTVDQAKKLAIQLNSGALPVPIKLVEERTVGASMGAESVQKSIKAGIVGLVMVMVFMVLSYGKLGLVADIALIFFGVLTLALYKTIPIVLTLPGIAGFLLSVGMAVDSNILIFERFKEEKDKRSHKEALEISFGRAWDSIRDANIATLVTAFILANPFDWPFLHTSGPVRGFAITLALGIAISLFTGIVVSRNLLRIFIRS